MPDHDFPANFWRSPALNWALAVMTAGACVLPFRQACFSGTHDSWHDGEVVSMPVAAGAPLFRQSFVNSTVPGAISHVSSLAPLEGGRMACAWYRGRHGTAPDVVIQLAFYDEETGVWSRPRTLIDRESTSRELGRLVGGVGNAVLLRDAGGRLWIFYASRSLGGWSMTSINYKVSSDRGETWSGSRKLVLSPFLNLTHNVRNRGISLRDGSFLLPLYHELLYKMSYLLWVSPGPGSLSYEMRRISSHGQALQPAVVHEGGTVLRAFFRNAEKGRVLTATSGDMGRSWSATTPTSLANPGSALDAIVMSDGSLLAVVNDSPSERSNLSLMLSKNRGRHWTRLAVLENDPAQGQRYSYPFLSGSFSGNYHLTYTFEETRIKHLVFNEAWIREQEGRAH